MSVIMENKITISEVIARKMQEMGIDVELSLQVLQNYNAGRYDHFKPVKAADIPEIDGKQIIDVTGGMHFAFDKAAAQRRITDLGIELDLTATGKVQGESLVFDRTALKTLGTRLYPLLAYGVLNGGSASSYVDQKKNRGFNQELFTICESGFHSLAEVSKGRAKGLTPAFINEDGTHGPSFLELKMRAVLISALQYQELTGSKAPVLYPMFQMTSVYNNEDVLEAYRKYEDSPLLKDLIFATGLDITQFSTGIQPMLAALSHSKAGRPKTFFLNANGKTDQPLAMPGGHGQNFIILKNIYRNLYKEGKRFVYLGNVDNLGFTIDPVCLALLALKGSQAGFDFSFRTPVDVKGGVLIIDEDGKFNCADIGVGISAEEVARFEKAGKKILFNCATGLFNLEYLVNHIDYIIEHLPMRISDQQKDAGDYAQAEQVTWEIIGLLDDLLIFGVDKYSRFLAAKLLLEGLMTSGTNLRHPQYPVDEKPEKNLRLIAENLHRGLTSQLESSYGMRLENSRWVPKSIEELKTGFRH